MNKKRNSNLIILNWKKKQGKNAFFPRSKTAFLNSPRPKKTQKKPIFYWQISPTEKREGKEE